MTKNKKLLLIIGSIIVLVIITQQQNNVQPQTVVPSCFEKEDCRVAPSIGYCDVDYDCIAGVCYSDDVLCPESCGNGKDDDLDGIIDCDDTDCWNNPICSCTIMSFGNCMTGRCFCPDDSVPRWYISPEEGNSCLCI